MGNVCGLTEEIPQSNHIRQSYSNQHQPIKSKKNQQEKEFKDFEEYKNGKTIGNGIQQIPSYKCPIAYDQLNSLREEFWNSKTSNRRVWSVIRECCSTDHETAVLLLEVAEMACLEGNLRQVFLFRHPEFIFKVPNFCICDPCFEREYDKMENDAGIIQSKPISVVLYYLALNRNINVNVTNKDNVKRVKELFAKEMKINMSKQRIRLLFKGQELVDDHLLYYHNVENGSKIQVMVRSID